MNEDIFCWTHHDLDGLASCLTLKWIFGDDNFKYQTTTGYNFREDFMRWKNKLSDYTKVFIVDLDISEHQDLVDEENVYIIDHHNTHVENASYEFAHNTIIDYSSACRLIYSLYKDKAHFTDAQKLFIALADDYDSFNFELPESKILNTLFWNTQKNFSTFMELYKDGFVPFTQQQIAIYELNQKEFKKTINNLKFFEGKDISVSKKPYHFIATFADRFIDEIAEYIFEQFNPDVSVIINLRTEHVSFRRHKQSDINLGQLSETIADGGGHAYASGGKITDNLLSFTKLLKPKK